jgi:predicted MFS family arabinose efflux permease
VALARAAGTMFNVALALVTLTGVLEGPSLAAFFAVRPLAAFFTVRQRHTPPHLRGQVLATVSRLGFVGIACGSALAGPVHAALGTTATLLMFGVLEIASSGAILTARRALRGTASRA